MPETKIQVILDNLANRNERILRIALHTWMLSAQRQIQQALTTKFKKDITSDLTNWDFIEDQGTRTLKPATLKIMQTGGNQAYKQLAVAGSFDILNVRAVKAADKFCANLVKDVTANTRKGVRTYIREGIKAGKAMPKIAKELRPLVGLTGRQTESIINYRKLLVEKRPDLSAAQVDKRVMTYTNKTHRRRMENIARTETARAQNIGYAQGLEEVGVVETEFKIAPTDACDECIALDGTRFPVSEAGGIIPVHPRCRCAMLPVVDNEVITETLMSAPAELPGAMASEEGLMPWKRYLGEHTGEKSTSGLLYDWYKLRYETTGKITSGTKKFLRAKAPKFEATSIKISKPIPGLEDIIKPLKIPPSPKPPVIAPKPGVLKPVIPKPTVLEHAGKTSQAFKDAVELNVNSYPPAVREALARSNITIRTGENVTQINYRLGGRTPRGWPRGMTWNNAEGFYDSSSGIVAIAENYQRIGTSIFRKVPVARSKGILNHEVGHAFSRTTPKGTLPHHNMPKFIEAYNKDMTVLRTRSASVQLDFRYYMQSGSTGRSETFAEAFARIMGKQAGGGNMAKYFPNSTKYIDDLLKVKPPVPKPPGLLPKSYFNEIDKWDERLVKHKASLRERLGFDIEALKMQRTDLPEYKEALAKFEKALKSYTKPTADFNMARSRVTTEGVYSKFEPKAKRNINKFYDTLQEIGCDDFIKSYGNRGVTSYIYQDSVIRQSFTRYRANANIRQFAVNMSQSDNVGVYFHELGHLVEYHGTAKAKAYRWLRSRGQGKSMPYSRISSCSKDPQNAYKDKFIDPYVGKFYRDGHTEVISMGMQQFTSYKSMMRFAKKDFDHFAFIHGILTGAI